MNIFNVKIIVDEDDIYIVYFEELFNIFVGGENMFDVFRELVIVFELVKDEDNI